MDLRGKLTAAQVDLACQVLDYQPFVIRDDIQTGCAYSKIYGVNLTRPQLLFHRREFDPEEWKGLPTPMRGCAGCTMLSFLRSLGVTLAAPSWMLLATTVISRLRSSNAG